MDPITQGTLGAALPSGSARKRTQVMTAGLLGFLAGMTPDLDVFIRSSEDPLLFLEYHRHFTHSLIFIPIGGFISSLILHALLGRRRGLTFRESWLYCTLGYATHAVLDACTTYGTMLFWPFSDERIAWNVVSVIDPLFTVPLIALVLLAVFRGKPLYARLGLAWVILYLCLGLMQRNEATTMGYEIAAGRGHEPLSLEAKPSFGNILVWKVVYETPDHYFVDAVRASIAPKVYEGDSVAKLDLERDLPWLQADTQQAKDVERFRWFSNGYVAADPTHPNRVIDIRYSMIPNELEPLWSIELDPDAAADEHAAYLTHRDAGGDRLVQMWNMLFGS
ncbi:MAG: metal-dependent hydrolase [Pseudomonadota bacterium]